MKVAITCQDKNLSALIDSRFGRCSYFAIFDTESKETNFLENPNKEVDEGAGPASVSFIAQQGVSKIVSGEFGIKVKGLLNDLKIQMVIVKQEKTVKEVVDLLID